MAFDRFACIVRAARIEAAVGAHQRPQGVLVRSDEEQEQALHRVSECSSVSRSLAASDPSSPRRARSQRPRNLKTISNRPIAGRRLRTASRRSRLARFRSTARPRCCRLITNPTRPTLPPAGIASNCRCSASSLRPARRTLAKAPAPLSRYRRLVPIVASQRRRAKRQASRGPWRGVNSARGARRRFSSGCESRGSACVGSPTAGRCVS